MSKSLRLNFQSPLTIRCVKIWNTAVAFCWDTCCILEKVRHKLRKEIGSELPVSPEQRLAIFPNRCGQADCHYSIAEMTGLGVSTVYCIVVI